MASDSYPRPGFNSGQVTELLYERLASPQAADGVDGSPSDPAVVYADGTGTRTVRVRANRRALVRGFQYDSGTTDVDVVLPGNTSGVTRIDLIVLRLTRATWRVQETYIQGAPGLGVPSPVNQVDTGVWDLPLAQVTVANNAAALAANTVTPLAWYIGPDGQILCTPTTRPPHSPGRGAHDTSAGWILSDGTRWIPAGADSGASLLTMTGGSAPWVASHNTVWRRNGWVSMQLTARRPLAFMFGDSSYVVATVPAGFRQPAAYGVIQTTAVVRATNDTAAVSISPSGAVTVSPAVDIPSNQSFIISTASWPVDL